MNREQLEKKIKEIKPILKEKYKVKKIGIFGSYISGKATEQSDVDILVEFYENIGWDFIDLKDFLEEVLGKKVDLVTNNALKPQLKKTILGEVVFQ
ncbi:MAG: uncharacterized protein PWQ82_1694 [Thermosediminibacterales bacterium]|nr:uncharacterized protein [Thermosediminibacterales bacterium]MDK2836663.1 uncharacterized protein [Thermosediminibacterales bacterium]